MILFFILFLNFFGINALAEKDKKLIKYTTFGFLGTFTANFLIKKIFFGKRIKILKEEKNSNEKEISSKNLSIEEDKSKKKYDFKYQKPIPLFSKKKEEVI